MSNVNWSRQIVLLLILVALVVWMAVFSIDDNLKLIACNVGQGDAILIQKQTDQILIDGGPDDQVLDCLGRYMPFWDRKIELAVLTHWDSDHSSGLVPVFRNYKVNYLLTNNLSEPAFSTTTSSALEKEVGSKGVVVINPTNLPSLKLGLIYLDIVHPNSQFSDLSSNNYSVVSILKYGEFEALLTGDIGDEVGDRIAKSHKMADVDYIKIPHHGSKNGISENLLIAAEPEIAVISVGSKNRFGHPYQEVLDLLVKNNIRLFRTDRSGDIVLTTDGKEIKIK